MDKAKQSKHFVLTKRSFVIVAKLQKQAITKLTKQSFVLALLARSAYFALLSPNGESIKSSICTQSSPAPY